jgi:TPR repeat protein
MNRYLIKTLSQVIVFALVVSTSQSVWGGYQEGLDAYKRGDYIKALEEFSHLSAQGDALAQFALGQMYRQGKGVPKDTKIALRWYRKSAKQENKFAQHILGFIYEKGISVPKNYNVAVKWFHKSAEQGYANAQYKLGLMYGKGQGVQKDLVLSYMWFSLSVKNGAENAKKNRDLVEKYLSRQEVTRAKQLTRKWEEGYNKKIISKEYRAFQEMQKAGAVTLKLQNLHKQIIAIINDMSNVDSISEGLINNKISSSFAEINGIQQLLKIKLKLDSTKKEIDSLPAPSFKKTNRHLKKFNISKKLKIYRDYLPVLHDQATELYLTTQELFKSTLSGKLKNVAKIFVNQLEQLIVALESETIIMEKQWKLLRDNKHPQYHMTLCYIYSNKAHLKLLEFIKVPVLGVTAQESLMENISRIAVQMDKSIQRGELLAMQWGKNDPPPLKTKFDDKAREFLKSLMDSYLKSFKTEREMVEFLRSISKHWPSMLQEEAMSTYTQKILLTFEVIQHERAEEALARTKLISESKLLK